jgi:hypothetical protein
VAIAFGFAPGTGTPQSLGLVAGSSYLGPGTYHACRNKDPKTYTAAAESNKANSFVKKVTIPATAPRGQGIVTASLMSLYGALNMPTLSNYNVSVTFGDQTSGNYVSSQS